MADQRAGIGSVPLPPGYVLVEKLGSGGFATVWLAEQGQLGRRVAVKLLGETLDDSERERRFLAECRAIGRLSGHPAVVTVHDAGTTDSGHPYLVMEHLPGGSLHDRLVRSGPLPWTEVLDIGVHVADALAAAHVAGILHRDVKPANVLLDENGSPKLGDFGIARLAEGTNTATGLLVGTIPYTPPEVLSGLRPGPHADVWALGATLHALLSGRSPFSGDRDEPPAATIARVLRGDAPPLGPEVPAALRDLIGSMLASEPTHRPDGCADVVSRLQTIQSERGLPVTPARSTRSTAPTTPIGLEDATAVGLPALDMTTPPPTATPTPTPAPGAPAGDDPWAATVAGAATPTPTPPPPGPNLDLAKAPGEPDADAPTALGPAVRPADGTVGGRVTAETGPPVSPPPPTGSVPVDPATAVASSRFGAASSAPAPADPATSVLPASDPNAAHAGAHAGRSAPGAPPPGGYPAPPPPPGAGGGRSKAPLLVGVAVLVVLLLGAAAAVVLLGGGDDDDTTAGPDSSEQEGDDPAGSTTPDGPATSELAGPFGAPIVVPTGTSSAPTGGWDVDAGCGSNACAVRSEGGAAILARSNGDGTGAGTLTRVEADGSTGWTTPLSGLAGSPAIGQVNGFVLVATSDAANRTYRAYDPATGSQAFELQLEQDLRPILVPEQVSDRYFVILLGAADAYVVVDSQTGAFQRGEGLVLGSDRGKVYVDRGGVVQARAIGEDQVSNLWERGGVDSISEPGDFPAWRAATIAGGQLVVATATEVVGLGVDSGEVAWSIDVDGDGKAPGRPVAVSAASDQLVVVAAEQGDLGIDLTATDVPRWREVRDRLVLAPGYDDDLISAAMGTPLWAATADRLVVGQTGDTIVSIDLETGAEAASIFIDPAGGKSTYGLFAGGFAVLQAGTVTAYDYAGLTDLWSDTSHPEATGLVAIDGGVAVVDPTGLHGITTG